MGFLWGTAGAMERRAAQRGLRVARGYQFNSKTWVIYTYEVFTWTFSSPVREFSFPE